MSDLERITPTSTADIIVTAIGAGAFLWMFGAEFYLFCHRNWPPLKTKHLGLITLNTFGGFAWWLSFVLTFGTYDRPTNSDIWTNCALLDFGLSSMGIGLFTNSYTVRFYRNYQIFINHNAKMLPSIIQLAILQIPYVAYWLIYINSGDWTYDEAGQECTGNALLNYAMVAYLVLFALINGFFMFKLRRIRSQFNEYTIQRFQLLISIIWLVLFNVANVFVFEQIDRLLGRLIILTFGILVPFAMFWSIMPFLFHLIRGDKSFLDKYTYGFSDLPGPDQIKKGPLEQNLNFPVFRDKFKSFSTSKIADENFDFYEAVVKLENETDYFEREAKAMAIIDEFLRNDAPRPVNLSASTKKKIIDSTDIVQPQLFVDAKEECLLLLEQNLGGEFFRDTRYKEVQKIVEKEDSEINALDKAGLLPKGLAGEDGLLEKKRIEQSQQNPIRGRSSTTDDVPKQSNNTRKPHHTKTTASKHGSAAPNSPAPSSDSPDSPTDSSNLV